MPMSKQNNCSQESSQINVDNDNDSHAPEIPDPFPEPPDRKPFKAGFWDQDAYTTGVRKNFAKTLFLQTMLTAVAVLGILSIYWGSLWKIRDGIHNLNGWVVDFDGGAIGQAVQNAALNSTGSKQQVTWTVEPASRFGQGPSEVVDAVLNEKCWMAIVVHPGATAALDSAVAAADSSYNGSLTVTAYAMEARNENSYPLIIAPSIQNAMELAVRTFSEQHAKQVASNPNVSRLLSTAPTLITQPLYYTIDNLRPFDVDAASAADFVGLIYLVIIAFLITNGNYMARRETGITRHLRFRSLILVRYFSAIIIYFFLSLIFGLLSVAFQIPFGRNFGRGGFVIYWMVCWIAMCALGLALEAVITILTPRFTPFFMILWIIVNVSVCFYPLEILPPIYRYGHASPFYNVSLAVRTIVFSTRNQIGLNFGILFAWIAISLITIPVFQWIERRQEVRIWHVQTRHAKAA